jgi:outer membrane protein OmpA-like peptidoglycan-associated protein
MKNVNLLGTILLGLALAGMTGCKHGPVNPTPIPDLGSGSKSGNGNDHGSQDNGGALANPAQPTATQEPAAIDYGSFANLFSGPHNEDRDKFKQDTVYFDFDSATIKASEESKLNDIANYFKGNNRVEGLVIEGNCDERGTEKYNLSLGERRALAVREYLHNLQVDDHRLKTVTYGAMRPADPGHDESAFKQNRRDEFVLVTPK